MKNNKSYLVISILFVIFSVIVFVVPFPKDSVTFWIAYISEIIALAAQIIFAKRAFDGKTTLKSKVYGFPIFRIGYIYLGIQTAVSLIFMILALVIASLPAWIATVVCVVIIGAAALGLIGTEAAREQIEQVEQATHIETSMMRQLRLDSQNLVSKTDNFELKKSLEKLAENIRYSDPVSNSAIQSYDNTLQDLFKELQNAVLSGNITLASELVNKTQIALDDRNKAAKLNK